MRILEVIETLEMGGAETALVQRLESRPKNVSTYVVHGSRYDVNLRARLLQVADSGPPSPRIDRKCLEDKIQIFGPDAVILHSPRHWLRLLPIRADPKPLSIAVAHSEFKPPPVWRHLAAPLFARTNGYFDLHLAVSSRASFGSLCTNARNLAVVHLGASPPRSADPFPTSPPHYPERWAAADVRLLSAGRFVAQKNFPSLVRAIGSAREELADSRAHLLIIGQGSGAKRILQQIERLNLESLVTVIPRFMDLAEFFRVADWFVVSSRSEGGPLTLFESLLAGTPVCSTPTGVALDVINPTNGILAAGSAVLELREAILKAVAIGTTTYKKRLAIQAGSGSLNINETTQKFYGCIRSHLN